jgi:hypothetical protein
MAVLNVAESGNAKTNPLFRWSYVLSGFVFLGLAVQILGISLTDRNLHPLIVPTPLALRAVGYLGLAISFVATLLALAALAKARSDIRKAVTPAERRFIWIFVILAVLLSLPEWLWSCGGHPTWYMGLAG